MTIIEISLLVIAACHVVMATGAVIGHLRMQKLLKQSEPLVADTRRVLDNLGRIAKTVEEMSLTAKRLEERVADTAYRVMDEIEPPIRSFAAVIAGVRAGVSRFFDTGRNHRNHHRPHMEEGVEPTRRM